MSNKNIKKIPINLKYIHADYDKIQKNFKYPIDSFLDGLGNWTYNDVDDLLAMNYTCTSSYMSYFPGHDSLKKYLYCNLKLMHYICENKGKVCNYTKDDPNIPNYKPSIEPKNLLNMANWKKVYYYQEGENDSDEWVIVCKNKDDVYIYLRASCDYTGFDCQGGGMISFSKNKNHFWNLGLDHFGRSMVLMQNGIKMKIDIK